MKKPAFVGLLILILQFIVVRGAVAVDDSWFEVDKADLGAAVNFSPSWYGVIDLSYQEGADWEPKDFYLNYHRDDFRLRLGRASLKWGPGEESMILNDRQGFDMIDLAGDWTLLGKSIHWEQFWADLNDRAGSQRRLFGHRYEVSFGQLTLGGAETVVLSGDYSSDFYAPFIPYYMIQHYVLNNKNGKNTDSNIVVQFDFDWKQDDGSRFYGAAMIDDAPTTPPNESVPGRVGLQLGFAKPELLGHWGLRGEYTGITRYTYTYLVEAGDYTGPDLLIGNPLGPDAERWRLECFRPLNEEWNLAVRIDLEQRGEGRFGDRWTIADGGGYHFLEGIVESDRRLALQWERRLGSENFIKLLLGYEWIGNASNVLGASDNGFYGELGLNLRV